MAEGIMAVGARAGDFQKVDTRAAASNHIYAIQCNILYRVRI